MMGSPVDELGHNWQNQADETLHKVMITQPFYMGVFELTQKQYQLVMGANPSSSKGDNRPVERVSYNDLRGSDLGAKWPEGKQVDATSFFGKLRTRTGITLDLPTEAQWEYTCRAGTSTALNSGKNLTATEDCDNMAEVGRYDDNKTDGKGGYSQHTVVGKYKPNAWGFYDMHGNVAEWCRDWWLKTIDSNAVDPTGPSTGTYRIMRGGGYMGYDGNSWSSSSYCGYAASCRSACRMYNFNLWSSGSSYYSSNNLTQPQSKNHYCGFRVAAYPAE